MFSVYTHILGDTFVVWSRDVMIRFPTETALRQVAVSPRPPSSSLISWEDSRNSGKLLCSWLRFIIVKRYRLKSTKGRDTRERVQERAGGNSHLSPPGEAVGTVLPPPQWCGNTANQESSPETWCSEILLGSHHCLLVRRTSASSLFGHSYQSLAVTSKKLGKNESFI